MTQITFAASLTAFALLPIAMLLLRTFGPRWFTGILAFGIVALCGWFLANICIDLSFENACETVALYGDNPPQNVADACTSDGAARICGVLFGGLYALIYYAPFALVYESARWAWLLYRRRRANDELAG